MSSGHARPWLCRTEGCGYQLGVVNGGTMEPNVRTLIDRTGRAVSYCPNCGKPRLWMPRAPPESYRVK